VHAINCVKHSGDRAFDVDNVITDWLGVCSFERCQFVV